MAAGAPVVLAPAARRERRVPIAALAGLASVAAVVAVRAAGTGESPRVQEFVLVFTSIVVEALPFILAGALVSAVIAVTVSDRTFARIGRLPTGIQLPGAVACAAAFPVCECGSVPVGRRLLARGVDPAAAIAFMLAAPIVNPIVVASTWVAFSGSGLALEMTLARVAVGAAVAVVAGLVLRRFAPVADRAADHDHEHDQAGGRLAAVAGHLVSDFLFMGKFIVLGAALSAALQTMVPRDALDGLAGSALLAPLAMMALAFLLSLCSEADAFVAVSFSGFGAGSHLAFLALGPVIDVKLAVLYAGTFGKRFVLALAAVSVPLVLGAALLFEALIR